ncbi:MAG: hypothetical protein LUD02_08560, partial [Tannerellaceae bacterium]|nr:hypothetical protein [Tannerellaceae bacterium]
PTSNPEFIIGHYADNHKTNYRKASSVAKHPKPPKSDKSPKTFTEATAKERPVKKERKERATSWQITGIQS